MWDLADQIHALFIDGINHQGIIGRCWLARQIGIVRTGVGFGSRFFVR